MKKGSFCFAGAGFVLGLSLIMGGVFVQNGAAQEGSGGEPLVTWGDYVLQGTALVQYQGKTEQDLVIPPDLGITEIRDEAFYRSSIRSAAIPEGVTKLGTRSFSDCYHLERVTLPRSLAEIGKNAFSSCSSLASITLPASLTTIGNSAFFGCDDLIAIQVDRANRAYADQEGVLFNKGFTELIQYPWGKPASQLRSTRGGYPYQGGGF